MILLLGIGNILLNDEGVGIHVINRLEAEGYSVLI
jgi:Ni,Fe-hydrogenase maturation factor